MLKNKVECVCDTKDQLGESPIWVEEKNSIFWVDIKRSIIHKLNIKNNIHTSWSFSDSIESIGCIAHIKNNKFVAGTKNGFKFIDLNTNELSHIANPEEDLKNNRFNDGKCDNQGRFYAGTMNDFNNAPTGSFYILYNDLTYKKIDGSYEVTNGPAFSNDYKKIYFTDTRQGKIYSANLNSDGTIKEKKLFISISPKEGNPDGMTLDEEGYIWVAIFGGSCVNRYNKKGKLVDKIELPTSCITSCVFGGDNLDVLFITTASFKLTKEQEVNEPQAGSLFKIDLKIRGNKTNKFIHKV